MERVDIVCVYDNDDPLTPIEHTRDLRLATFEVKYTTT